MKKHSVRPQDKPQTKLRVSSRRARLLQLFREGKSTRAASKILKAEGHGKGSSQPTVAKDLIALRRDFAERVPEEREQTYHELKGYKKIVAGADDLGTGEQIKLLLEVGDRLTRLLGLDAPTKSIGVKVDASTDPATLVGYRKFVHVTSNMDAGTLEKVYEFAARLNAPPAMRVIGPPANSELWDDEPKQLTDGAE